MKIFLLSLCILFSAAAFAQAPAIQWQKSLGGTGNDEGYTIARTADGGYIIAGATNSNNGDVTGNHGAYDGWVVKLTPTGAKQWQKSIGGSGIEDLKSLSQTSDGGYIITGSSSSSDGDATVNHGVKDYWVVKLSSIGDIQWQKSLGGASNDFGYAVTEAPGGGYVVVGQCFSINADGTGNHGGSDALVVKLSADGDVLWKQSIGDSGDDELLDIKPVATGGYICVGFSNPGSHGRKDAWIVRLDGNGIVKWQKTYGGTNYESFSSVVITGDGGFIVGGSSTSNDGDLSVHYGFEGYTDAWLVKIDSLGKLQWQKSLGGSNYDQIYTLYKATDGNYVFAGYTQSNDGDVTGLHGNNDYWIGKVNPSGKLLWQKTLGGSNSDVGLGCAQTEDGGYIIVGQSYSNDGNVSGHHGTNDSIDAWVVKLTPDTSQYINISPNPSASICTGTPVTFTATSTGGDYQWKKNNINVGTNSPIYTDSTLQNGDTVLCIFTTGDTVLTSNAIGITVTTPSITIVGPGVLCAGNTATYKATAAPAGHPISYQWVKNNTNVGTDSNLYTDSNIHDGDSVWCNIISDAGCAAAAGLTSNKIVVKVLAYGAVTATVTYNPYNYKLCAPGDTTSVTFHAVGQYGGANPSFQWVLNNNVVGTDTSFYTARGVKAGDKIYCRYTSSQKCVTGDVHTVISNTVTLTAKATLTPAITIMQTPDTAVCAGTKVRFKISSLSGGGEDPIYQWMKNNVPVGTNSDVYYDSTLNNNDNVWCKMISHHPCLTAPATVISNKKKVKIDDALPPQPSAISGPATVTANQANINYSVSPQSNVTYLWSIPADASFVTDKHNSSVTINWGSTAGNIIAQTRNGCGYSAKRVLVVSVVPSLVTAGESSETLTATGKATLYPNPAKNFATISFTATAAGKYMVQVADANGRILQLKETNTVKGRNTININVSGYAKGSYFIRLTNKDGRQQATFTLVVAR